MSFPPPDGELDEQDKSSSALVGEIVAGFFERGKALTNVFVPSSDEPVPPPPECREMLGEQLQSQQHAVSSIGDVRRLRRGANLNKADRLKMEAALMASTPEATDPEESSADQEKSSADLMGEIVAGFFGRLQHGKPEANVTTTAPVEIPRRNNYDGCPSLSPPDMPADERLQPIPTHSDCSLSPDDEINPSPRERSQSSDSKPAVIRRRAASKEERKAEEKELAQEFRRQELSTWLDSSTLDHDTFATETSFVPYRPYVKSHHEVVVSQVKTSGSFNRNVS